MGAVPHPYIKIIRNHSSLHQCGQGETELHDHSQLKDQKSLHFASKALLCQQCSASELGLSRLPSLSVGPEGWNLLKLEKQNEVSAQILSIDDTSSARRRLSLSREPRKGLLVSEDIMRIVLVHSC